MRSFIAMNVFVNLLSAKSQGFVELAVWGPCYEIDYNPLLYTILAVNLKHQKTKVLSKWRFGGHVLKWIIIRYYIQDTILVQNGVLWARL